MSAQANVLFWAPDWKCWTATSIPDRWVILDKNMDAKAVSTTSEDDAWEKALGRLMSFMIVFNRWTSLGLNPERPVTITLPLGPWCCERGRAQKVMVCRECRKNLSESYQT